MIDFFYDQRDQIKLYEYDNGYLFAFKGYPLWTLGYLRLEEEEIFYQKFEWNFVSSDKMFINLLEG